MRKIKVTAIFLALGFILTSCNMVEVNEERDRETVIAKVEGEVILKGEVWDIINNQIDMYTAYGYYPENFSTDPQYAEYYLEMVNGTLDAVVDSKYEEVLARERGCYEFTAEEREDLDTQIHDIMNTYLGMYGTDLKEKPEYAGMSEEELGVIAYDTLDDYFEENGFGVTKQEIIDDAENAKAIGILKELVTKDVVVTEDEVKAEYDNLVATAKAGYEDGTANFEQDSSNAPQIYYSSENARQAQHILVAISDEAEAEIKALEADGDVVAADALLEEALAEIKDLADQAYQRAIDGEDFKMLMDEIGNDPGMKSKDFYVVMNPTSMYAEEFAAGLFALKNVGDISEPVSSSFGYHIIKYYGDVESGPVAYDDVHDDIYDSLLSTRKDEEYQIQFDLWKADADITVYSRRFLN